MGRERLINWINRIHPSETSILLTLAVIVGLLTAAGEILFHKGIDWLTFLSFEKGRELLSFMSSSFIIVPPMLGGLLVGVIAHSFYSHHRPHGVAGVMEAVALRGGRLNAKELFLRVIGSVLTIGSGGSAGPEDPSVQIGAAFGTAIGQGMRLPDERVRGLVASGAAAGIGAAFNAPIAGIFFALEIVLGEVTGISVGIIVVSSVVSALLTHALVGPQPAFVIPAYSLVSHWELLLYLLLGFLAGLVSVLYIISIRYIGEFFARLKCNPVIRPSLGGLVIGLIGLFTRQIFGVGYEGIETILKGQNLLAMSLFLLVFAKMFATSVTLGSGGQGGMFAPALFLGAMLGGGFGIVANNLFPSITATPQAYVLVGMAAVLAGAVHAPITSIILLFEMTQDYRIVLPLMFAVVISTVLSEHWYQYSVYSQALNKMGINLESGHDLNVMQGVMVEDAMTTDVKVVSEDMSLSELRRVFIAQLHHSFPVVDEKGALCGIVSIQDFEKKSQEGNLEKRRVSDIATRTFVVAYPNDSVWSALRKMGARGVWQLPVVDRENPKRIIGIVGRNDIIRTYEMAMRQMQEIRRAERWRFHFTDIDRVELKVRKNSPIAGKRIEDVEWPGNCLLISIRGDKIEKFPHGQDILKPGNLVVALVDTDNIHKLKSLF